MWSDKWLKWLNSSFPFPVQCDCGLGLQDQYKTQLDHKTGKMCGKAVLYSCFQVLFEFQSGTWKSIVLVIKTFLRQSVSVHLCGSALRRWVHKCCNRLPPHIAQVHIFLCKVIWYEKFDMIVMTKAILAFLIILCIESQSTPDGRGVEGPPTIIVG